MKIEEYGILFQPMFYDDCPPVSKIEACVKHIIDYRTTQQDYQLGIKVIWNGKAATYLQLKIVQDIYYIKLMESRIRKYAQEQDQNFLEKLLESLPPMQNHGNLLVGIVNI